MVLKPQIINNQFVLKSYDGSALAYGSDTSGDEFTVYLIQYGSGSTVELYAYKLQSPSAGYSYSPIFEGMAARPLSTDIVSWQTVVQDNPSYSKTITLPTVSGAVGVATTLTIVETTTNAQTYSPSAKLSASAEKLGFEVEADVEFSMEIQTTTTMTKSLGFNYALPECSEDPSVCCIAQMDVSPYILVPNDDATGYNAPWISNDIRNNGKPKPWCLTYKTPATSCSTGSLQELAVKKATGSSPSTRLSRNTTECRQPLV